MSIETIQKSNNSVEKINKVYIKVVGILTKRIASQFSPIFGNIDERKEIILICSYSEFDIPIGHIFGEISVKEVDRNVIRCQIDLKQVSQEFFKEYGMIPRGHKTICKFEFLGGKIPDVVYSLPVSEGWHDTNDTWLYFQ